MSQESLGLYDTPADRQVSRFAFVVIGLLLIATIAVLPVRDVRWPEINAFVPMVNAIMFVGGLIECDNTLRAGTGRSVARVGRAG